MNRPPAVTAGRVLWAALLALFAGSAASQDLRNVAETPNQLRTADALERFYANATNCDCELAQAVRYLRLAPADEARNGLDALSGQDLAGMLGPRQSLSTLLTQRLAWQLRPSGPEPPRRVIEYVDTPLGGASPAVGGPCDPACGARRAYLAPPRPVIWLQGFGAAADQGGGPGAYDAGLGGVLFGGHVPVTDDVAVGLAANYGHLDADATRTNLNVDTWRFLGYGRYVGETAYAFGGAGYGVDDYATNRRIAFGPFDRVASGDAGGNEAFAFAETGLTLPISGEFALQPFVGLTGSHISRDGFAERSDSAFELNVAGADASAFATYLGGRAVMQRYLAPDLLLRPEVRVAWWHDYLADAGSATVSFVRDPSIPFTVAAAAPGRNAAVLGAGATLVTWGQCSFGAQYDAAITSEATLHAFALTALCSW